MQTKSLKKPQQRENTHSLRLDTKGFDLVTKFSEEYVVWSAAKIKFARERRIECTQVYQGLKYMTF